MSQPAGNRSNSFMQAMLLAVTIFLGLQLLNGGMNRPADTRPLDDILKNVRKLNAEGSDITIVSEVSNYERKVDDVAKKEKWPDAQRDEKLAEAYVLRSEVALRAGKRLHEHGRTNAAYTQIDGLRKRFENTSFWTEKFKIPTTPEFNTDSISLQQLYDDSRDVLSAQNKHELVFGFIPGYALIDWLVGLTGHNPAYSYAFAGLFLALLLRTILFPLQQKQLHSGRQMQQLSPLIKELQAKHKRADGSSDQVALQQDMMQLYKEYGINPVKGCIPAFIQMPFFIAVFQAMLLYKFEFQKGTFLWMNPATSAANHGFTAPNLGHMDPILLVIYGVTMIRTTLLQPVTDPTQIKTQRMMGLGIAVFFTISMFFYPLPSAFVLYWIFLNIFTTAQSLVAYRQPAPPLVKVQTAAGGVRPRSGFFEKMMEMQSQQLETQKRLEDEQKKNKPKKGDKFIDGDAGA